MVIALLMKGRPMKRLKPTRGMKVDRFRTPYPLPRPPGKGKAQHPRPSPSSRKRRLSGRLMWPSQHSNASEEGDMAQADEMGEGEGRDDGFVEGLDPISRRRNKKRPGMCVCMPDHIAMHIIPMQCYQSVPSLWLK